MLSSTCRESVAESELVLRTAISSLTPIQALPLLLRTEFLNSDFIRGFQAAFLLSWRLTPHPHRCHRFRVP